MRRRLLVAVVAAACALPGCARAPQQASGAPAPIPRRSVVWLGSDGVDHGTAAALSSRGVDLLVARRGSVRLAGGVPVLRLDPLPPVRGPVPAAISVRLEGLDGELDPSLADVVWRGLAADFGSAVPAELILDLERTPPGLAGLVERLAFVSGVPVIPMLLPEQLGDAEARNVIRAARGAVIPAFGTVEALRASAQESARPLRERLAPLEDLGVRVRVAVVLEPVSQPPLGRWSEGFADLARQGAAEWATGAALERSLSFRRPVEWNGRGWRAGERVTLRWVDAARLDSVLREVGRVFLPEVDGWDLMFLPPEGRAVGLSREALLAYLQGEGPGPALAVTAERRGTTVTARMTNPGPFSSAPSGYGNWLEIGIEGGTLVADQRGDFDRISLGVRRQGGEWQRADAGGVTAVRFGTPIVAPGTDLATGPVRLTRREARVTLRWQVVLSTGEEVGGSLVVPP